MSRRGAALAAAGLAVVVAAGIALVLVTTRSGEKPPARPRAAVGELLESSGGDVPTAGRTVPVRLPWGDLRISAGAAVETLPDNGLYSNRHSASWHRIDPPENGVWLPLRIQSVLESSRLYRARTDAEMPQTTVAVVTGSGVVELELGELTSVQRRVGGLAGGDFTGYVAVSGPLPGDVQVRVTFDGVTQDVFLDSGRYVHGRATPLYASAATDVDAPCGPASVRGYRLEPAEDECRMAQLRALPWIAGLGWSAPGRSWLLAAVVAGAPGGDLTRAGYAYEADLTATMTSTLMYDGLRPVAQGDANALAVESGELDAPQLYVFDIAIWDSGRRAPYRLTTRFTAQPAKVLPAGAPRRPVLTAQRTIAID
ncbi:hypothetical protein [Jatrophihabitans fulvus]